jgi:hypothetical protein
MLSGLDTARLRAVLDAMQAIQTNFAGPQPPSQLRFRSHRAGDMGWVIARHGELYASEFGWTQDFEALVAQIAAEFVRNFDATRERCWIAERGGRRLGCIFVMAAGRRSAKLRLLLVEPEGRGSGSGTDRPVCAVCT